MRLVGLLLVVATPLALATAPAASDDAVLICHRTDSQRVPYVQLLVTHEQVLGPGGHASHGGPIFGEDAGNVESPWGDIIPAFEYATGDPSSPKALFPGTNWPEGEAIWRADCVIPGIPDQSPEEPVDPVDPGEVDGSVPVEIADPGALALEEEASEEPTPSAVPTSIPAGGGAAEVVR